MGMKPLPGVIGFIPAKDDGRPARPVKGLTVYQIPGRMPDHDADALKSVRRYQALQSIQVESETVNRRPDLAPLIPFKVIKAAKRKREEQDDWPELDQSNIITGKRRRADVSYAAPLEENNVDDVDDDEEAEFV